MENITPKTTQDYEIQIIEYSKYVQPSIVPAISRKWTLNGDNNGFYTYIKDCYEGSPTNAGIINGFVNYIYADGLIDLGGTNINKYIKKSDVRLICQDYKTYGAYAVQVIWNSALNPADKKPILIKYIPVFKLGLNLDKNNLTDGYWYCFDWEQIGKYKPKLIPKYNGVYTKGQDLEILMIQRPSSNSFFANPDYVSGLQYAQLEMELANSSINHVLNGFQGTKVVNCNNGVPPTEELKAEYKGKIIRQLTGTNNTNKVIVSFNEDKDKGIEVTDIPVVGLNDQYVHFEEVAQEKLITAHSAPVIIFSADRSGGGLGSNADELKTATQSLYRRVISPMREVILDGLEEVFTVINPDIKPAFKDFEEFAIEEPKTTL